jgi:hypothetical protein
MHPVLLILLAWLALDAALLVMALFSARHRSRRLEARMEEVLEQPELRSSR